MKKILLIPFLFALASCTSYTESSSKDKLQAGSSINLEDRDDSLHLYVEKLARQLFDTTNIFDISRPVIVGTFLPAESLKVTENDKLDSYGIQIQESLSTLLTQAGLHVVEYKTLSKVRIEANSDVMLSRDVNELDIKIYADYILTGTYVERESSLIVNARLINISDKKVIAAATDYIPINSMWNHSKVSIRNQKMYRSEY